MAKTERKNVGGNPGWVEETDLGIREGFLGRSVRGERQARNKEP